jgi:hypothetical protein
MGYASLVGKPESVSQIRNGKSAPVVYRVADQAFTALNNFLRSLNWSTLYELPRRSQPQQSLSPARPC